jgi:hypothetical protein
MMRTTDAWWIGVGSICCCACLQFEPAATKPTEEGDGDSTIAGDTDTQCRDKLDFDACGLQTRPELPYDICVSKACVSPGCGKARCNVPGPGTLLPDTNLLLCFDDTDEIACPNASDSAYFGQDAQYGDNQTDRFSKAGTADEPVVMDSVTGLAWQGCLAGAFGDDCGSSEDAYSAQWGYAVQACRDLEWGGYDDWRLPDVFSLISIINLGAANGIYTDYFVDESGYALWSSTTHPGDEEAAFTVVFDKKTAVTAQAKAEDSGVCVRCIRGEITPRKERFQRVGTEDTGVVIKDSYTGLAWQGCDSDGARPPCIDEESNRFTWREALRQCQGSAFGGYDDWRLPNANELSSLLNVRDTDMSASRKTAEAFWSSTTAASAPSTAWAVSFENGSGAFQQKGDALLVWCVRE